MDRDTELALVCGLRAGEPGAFDAVHRAFNARLFSFLARLAGSRDTAEDLLAETWMRLVAHAHRLRDDTRLGPWLFTVARNLHVSYRRSRLIEDGPAADFLSLWPTTTEQPSPFEDAAANELERRLEAGLAALSSRDREVLLLVGVEGLSPAEAAAICGVSGETLRQRLSRARARLAEVLDDEAAQGSALLGEVLQ